MRTGEIMLVRAVSSGRLYIGTMADYLRRVADKLRDDGFAVSSQLLHAQPAPGIVALASQTPQSLITLTTHGRSALARWFIGCVMAWRVLALSHCSHHSACNSGVTSAGGALRCNMARLIQGQLFTQKEMLCRRRGSGGAKIFWHPCR
jgi:hypothetical protein